MSPGARKRMWRKPWLRMATVSASGLSKTPDVSESTRADRKAENQRNRQASRDVRSGKRGARKLTLDAEYTSLKATLVNALSRVSKGSGGLQPSIFSRLDPEGEIT